MVKQVYSVSPKVNVRFCVKRQESKKKKIYIHICIYSVNAGVFHRGVANLMQPHKGNLDVSYVYIYSPLLITMSFACGKSCIASMELLMFKSYYHLDDM